MEGSGQPDHTVNEMLQAAMPGLALPEQQEDAWSPSYDLEAACREDTQAANPQSKVLIAISLLLERQGKFSSDSSSWFICDKVNFCLTAPRNGAVSISRWISTLSQLPSTHGYLPAF